MEIIQCIQILITIIKDIFTCLAAITASVVAVLGLQAWKKQLKGKTEYELAQRLLRGVYRVRNAFADVRNPRKTDAEIAQAMREENIEGDPYKDPTVKGSERRSGLSETLAKCSGILCGIGIAYVGS